MEEDKKESHTWRSSASEVDNLENTQGEENLAHELTEKLNFEEENTVYFISPSLTFQYVTLL